MNGIKTNQEYTKLDNNELREKKRLLRSENETYAIQIKKLTSEIDVLHNAIASGKENISMCQDKLNTFPDNIKKSKAYNELLLVEINNLKLRIRNSIEDEENYSALKETFTEEIQGLKDEKTFLLNKINSVNIAIKEIISEKKRNMPKLKEYDDILKAAYKSICDTKSRMDVNLTLKQR